MNYSAEPPGNDLELTNINKFDYELPVERRRFRQFFKSLFNSATANGRNPNLNVFQNQNSLPSRWREAATDDLKCISVIRDQEIYATSTSAGAGDRIR